MLIMAGMENSSNSLPIRSVPNRSVPFAAPAPPTASTSFAMHLPLSCFRDT